MATATRRGPADSATAHSVGTRKRGLDGRMWRVVTTQAGVRRWQAIPGALPPRLYAGARVRPQRAEGADRGAAKAAVKRMRPVERKGKKITDIAVKRSGRDWEDNAGSRRRHIWIHIAAGYVYLAHGAGRAYWVLTNISPETRPRIAFVEPTRTMRIASFRVRFARPVDFAFARACLERFSRRE